MPTVGLCPAMYKMTADTKLLTQHRCSLTRLHVQAHYLQTGTRKDRVLFCEWLCRPYPWLSLSFKWVTLFSFKLIHTLMSVTQSSHFGCVSIGLFCQCGLRVTHITMPKIGSHSIHENIFMQAFLFIIYNSQILWCHCSIL